MNIKWNTGRAYTQAGQIIRAKLLDDGSVVFADDSRCVDGHLPIVSPPITSATQLRAVVMRAYDHGKYKPSADSWQFLMQPSQTEEVAR